MPRVSCSAKDGRGDRMARNAPDRNSNQMVNESATRNACSVAIWVVVGVTYAMGQ